LAVIHKGTDKIGLTTCRLKTALINQYCPLYKKSSLTISHKTKES